MQLIRQTSDWPDSWGLVSTLQDEMNRLFSSSLRRSRDTNSALYLPEIDFAEEGDHYLVKADLPGMKKEDVEISVTGNLLTIKGERKEEHEKKAKNYYHVERRSGSFQRTIELPTEVDSSKTAATYKDGVLELTLPKAESAKPKQIKVEVK